MEFRLLTLTQNRFSKIDGNLYPIVSKTKWTYSCHGYAVRTINRKRQYLHRFIMDVKKGETVDHINGDKLDNRLSNLRVCSQSINCLNKHKLLSTNSSGYNGIRKHIVKSNNNIYEYWESCFQYQRKRNRKFFKTLIEAIKFRKDVEHRFVKK
jgi:hypothetical protein